MKSRKTGTRCCSGDASPLLGLEQAEALASILQVVGHPIRLQILDILARKGGQVCVCDLEAALPVKQPTISHHLKLLRDAGLVGVERHGQWAYYHVRGEGMAEARSAMEGLLERLE